MAKIQYSATTADGRRTEGELDAMSVESALDDLQREGLRDIDLHRVPAPPAPPLPSPSRSRQRALLRFQRRLQRSTGLDGVLADVARRQRWWLMLDAGLIAAGLATGRLVWLLAGIAGAIFPFAVSLSRWRRAGRYQQLLKLSALGDWRGVRHLVPALREIGKASPLMDFDLDVRLATADAHEGRPAAALAALQPWRARLVEQPGLFEGRLAAVVLAGGDTAGCLQWMAESAERSGGDVARQLDLALTQARFGDVDNAASLLGRVDTGPLPKHAVAFEPWVRGLVQLRRREPEALASLDEALDEFLRLAEQPAAWPALALCACDHAVALNLAGQTAAARRQVAQVWPVLSAQAPRPLLRMLEGDGLLPPQPPQHPPR